MAARSIGSVTLLIGLVAIPAKLFTAVSTKEVKFNRLHKPPCGSRIQQRTICAAEDKTLESEDVVLGYEYTPDKFVTFSPEELKALELAADPGRIRVVEVVPLATIDPKYLSRTVYLGPDKGAARAYRLIASQLEARASVAVGQLGTRTRDDLVIVRPHEGGLVLHECYYADEVRSFAETEAVSGAPFAASRVERQLAGQLLDGLARPAFDAERFTNGGAERVRLAVARKVEGKEIVVPMPRASAETLDLEESLRASVAELGPGTKKAPASRVRSGRARATG